ncbi:MAG: rRNA maturation RNase YbeY [Planctomycetes bacterium]|nr:rRNA maturation RNase YbeY [Planctomycetota bacterium]
MPPRALQIRIAWRLRQTWRAKSLLERVARHVETAEGFSSGQLSIAVVGAAAMSTLHARFLHQAGPTDVLAFDLGTSHQRRHLDGEVILCADVARQQAARRLPRAAKRTPATLRRAARAELSLYLVHGLLHLAGYDDHAPAAYRRMHAREDVLLEELGLGAVFRAGGNVKPDG